jgi:hypothetical protein
VPEFIDFSVMTKYMSAFHLGQKFPVREGEKKSNHYVGLEIIKTILNI